MLVEVSGRKRLKFVIVLLLTCCGFFLLPGSSGNIFAAASGDRGEAAGIYRSNGVSTAAAHDQLLVATEEIQQEGAMDMTADGTDTEDDVTQKATMPGPSARKQFGSMERTPAAMESLGGYPPTPPPMVQPFTSDEKRLYASYTPSSKPGSVSPDAGKTAPEPKTSKTSSLGMPVLVGAGVVVAAGAALAAGGGSGSDSDNPNPTAPGLSPGDPGDSTPENSETIRLASLVRIGDDRDYNGNHPDHFRQNTPSGLSWSDTFTINNTNTVTSATFKYTVAGSKVGNPVYINGRQAGRLCDPGNTAWNVKDCSLNIQSYIRSGSNEIKIKCAIDETDTTTPYDDVEIYDLVVDLQR